MGHFMVFAQGGARDVENGNFSFSYRFLVFSSGQIRSEPDRGKLRG